MMHMQQAGPPVELAAPAPIMALPQFTRRCGSRDGDEIVVCGHTDPSPYRLKPLPVVAAQPGFFQRPHVIKLAPNVSVGLLGNGKGVGARMEF